MSEKSIERMTEAAVLAEGSAGVSREQLGQAIDWLGRAAPENGINLVPWWEERLRRETQSRRRPRRWQWPVGLAACLLIGLALGAAAGAGIGGSRSTAPLDHYSARQQQLMFALLDSTAERPAATYRSAATELVGCLECHEALRRRVATGWSRPVTGNQSKAMPALQRMTATLAQRGTSLCRQNRLWQSGLQFMVWRAHWSAAITPRFNIIAYPSRRSPQSKTVTATSQPRAWTGPRSALRRSATAS